MKGTGPETKRGSKPNPERKSWRRHAIWVVMLVVLGGVAAIWLVRPISAWRAEAGLFGSTSPKATPTQSVIAGTPAPAIAVASGNLGAAGDNEDQDDNITGGADSAAPAGLAIPTAATSAGDWPMYGHDNSRTNYDSAETTLSRDNIAQIVSQWQANIGFGTAPTSSAPSISGGRVYVGSSVTSGTDFYSFDAVTGGLLWTASLGASPTCFGVGIGATSAISGSVVVAGGADSAYYGLDSATGDILWRSALDEGPSAYAWASPLIVGDRAYIGVASGCDNPSVRGEVRTLSLADGSTLSRQAFVPEDKAGAGIWNSPALTQDGQTLVVSTGEDYGGYNGPYNRAIVALDPGSLLIRDAYQEGPLDKDSDYATTPIVFHDSQGRTLVAANHKDENFYVYDLDHLDAGPVWQQHTGTIVGMMPAYDPTLGDGGTLFFMDGLGDVHAVDPATGADRWPPAHVGTVHGNMAVADGIIFLNAGLDGLKVLGEKDGQELATFVPDNAGKAYSGVAVSRGFVYWLSGGYLNAWSLP